MCKFYLVIHVDGSDAEGFGHGQACGAIFDLETGMGGGFGEAALAVIVIEVGVGACEVHGRTVDLSEDEIEIAVVVDIGEGGATSDDRLGDIGA